MKRSKKHVVFKDYSPNQMMLLPPTLDELIPQSHPVRVVNQVIESIECSPLLKQYKGGGTSSYHPRMLLKVMVFSYLCNIYSSRKMEAALKENLNFMWLSGMSYPDHNTLNRFRCEKLQKVLKEIFSQVVLLLVESGHVSLKQLYLDGTKIEANANRYTFVWGKSISYNKSRIAEQLQSLWAYTQEIASEELKDITPTDFAQIDAEKVKQTIENIDNALRDKEVDKKVKQKLTYARKNWPQKMEQYQQQQEILDGRNSFSKTDEDATFMRMKEDHMRNGQLKPGYNVQISTCDQYILSYSLHHNPTDTTTLPKHLEYFYQLYGVYPSQVVADAGYGSEENYNYLENKSIEAFVKYGYFDKDQRKNSGKSPFHQDNLFYNTEKDCYYCPMGQPMSNIGTVKHNTDNGYKQTYTRYRACNCQGCPLKNQCHKQFGNRTIEVNHRLIQYKKQATELLTSEQGLYHRSKRGVDVEPVFANIKHNKGFKRFMLRGLSKTEIEIGLLSIAHNLKKFSA